MGVNASLADSIALVEEALSIISDVNEQSNRSRLNVDMTYELLEQLEVKKGGMEGEREGDA